MLTISRRAFLAAMGNSVSASPATLNASLFGPDLLGGDAFDYGPKPRRLVASTAPVLVSFNRRSSQRSLHTSTSLLRIIKSEYPKMDFPKDNFLEFMFSKAENFKDRTALVDALTDRSVTYEECHTQCAAFAASLQEAGAQKDDVMAVFMPNLVEYPIVFIGASGAGVINTTLNPVYTAAEISKQLELSGAKWAATTVDLLPTMREAIDKIKDDGKRKVLSAEGRIFVVGEDGEIPTDCKSVREMFRCTTPLRPPPIDAFSDVCVLPYSSGTTGVPKGVMLTHHNMVANICQTAWGPDTLKVCQETMPGGPQEVTVSVLPMFHAFAMNVTMGPTMYHGGKMVILPKFVPEHFVAAIAKHKPNYIHVAPPLLAFLANHPSVTAEHLAPVKYVIAAAAPVGVALINKFKEKAPHCVVREGWGMSETSPGVLFSRMDNAHPGSCGKLILNSEAKIVDVSTGESLGPNQPGELVVRGPQIMKGYLNNPTATAETIKRDGWLHSGDIAMYDEQERFFIVDRLKELIKVKGFQVPPAELEDLLRTNVDIADVAVIGIPHEKFGEAPRAYIVLKPSVEASDAKAEEICTFVSEQVAEYKRLIGGVQFVDAVPKSQAGKILRKDLRAAFKAEQEKKSS